jgi:16S rRNA (guanine966-N2)-methyltransferase
MSIRVIAGSARGRKLKLVPGDSTRPIMDRVKEALFSIIGADIYDSHFLDVFAGTGSVGIEALSRGAQSAVFYDLERKAITTIQENVALARVADRAVIQRGDAFTVLSQRPSVPFDFVYIAPPQYKGMWQKALAALDQNPSMVSDEGLVIVQIDPDELEDHTLQQFQKVDERKYGNTLLLFYEKAAG